MPEQQACQFCSSRATLFLCPRCVTELKAQLHSLAHGPEVNGKPTPGLLDALADVELKRTRLGGGGGHRKRGDEMSIPFLPDATKQVKDKQTGDLVEVTVESPQGWAATLLNQARTILSTIVRDVCETRGIDVMRAFRVVPADFTGPLMPGWKRAPRCWHPTSAEMARWLTGAVHALACDKSAGQWRAEIDGLVRSIERGADRPVRIELLGFCITQLDNGTCDTALRAPEAAIEVQCRKCRTVRRCDTVRNMAQSDARRALITWRQVLDTNRMQPDGWRVHDRTLRDWKATGVLKIRGYLRPDGGHGIHRRSDDDEPLYKWADIEQLRTRRVPRGERKRTRAGA